MSVVFIAVLSIGVALLIPRDPKFDPDHWEHLASNLTFVVTGANSGLGFATVEHLARLGTANTIVLACRSHSRCRNAQILLSNLIPEGSSTKIVTATLDLSSRESIQRFAAEILPTLSLMSENSTEEVKIDVLINNAGIFASNSKRTYVENIEEHMLVNHLGHVLLTHLLWPTLIRSNARVVAVSSISALVPSRPTTGWYESEEPWSEVHPSTGGLFSYFRSKRANLFFAQELHRRFGLSADGNSISSVASHPGYTRTEIWSNGGRIFPSMWAKMIQINPLFSMSSSDGALTQVWAALDRDSLPSGSYVGPRWWLCGIPIGLGQIGRNEFPQHFLQYDAGDELWNKTMEALGIERLGVFHTVDNLVGED